MPSVETTLIVDFIACLNLAEAGVQIATTLISRTGTNFQPMHRSVEVTVSAINTLIDRVRTCSKEEEQQVLVLFA